MENTAAPQYPTRGQPPVIFYGRFSTKDQSEGDSLRRQEDLASTWLGAKGWSFDLVEKFWDKGLSAFQGLNETQGELGRLIAAAESGKFPRGTCVLVENLDRLSRQDPFSSIALLNRMMSAGLRIVVLNDGREYAQGQVETEAMFSWILAGLGFHTANAESKKKALASKSPIKRGARRHPSNQ